MNATNRCYLSLIPFAAHTISSDKISPDKFCRQYYPEHYVCSIILYERYSYRNQNIEFSCLKKLSSVNCASRLRLSCKQIAGIRLTLRSAFNFNNITMRIEYRCW